jgi:GxxExxY protein
MCIGRLGPGLLESTYRSCLQHRLTREGLQVDGEVPISIVFDGVTISGGYRADLVINDQVLVELKSVDRLLPIHISQTLTYLKHSNLQVGLLLNFNVQSLRNGIRRFDNRNRSSDSLPRLPRLALPGL